MTRRKDGPRPAVIGTCTLAIRNIPDADVLLANGLAMIDEMAAEAERQGWSLDIVALPEHFALPTGSKPSESGEALDGRTVSAVAEKARAHGTYAVVPMYVREGDVVYNSCVLLDRSGEPIGVYHKVFPVVSEDGSLEDGITPGREFPVWELDFGRVGIQICFDVVYEDGWRAMAAQEAELVIFSSAAPGAAHLVSHAYRFGYYIMGSIFRPPALIVNPVGHVIARSSQNREVTVARVDLDYRIVPSYFLWARSYALKDKYGDTIDWGWHDAEGPCLMTSSDPEMPIGRFLETEGIQEVPEWLAYNRRVQDEARGGQPVMPPELAGE